MERFKSLKCPYCESEKIVCPKCGGAIKRGLTAMRPLLGARCTSCGIPLVGYALCGGCGREVKLQVL